jgi:hypothetical protein
LTGDTGCSLRTASETLRSEADSERTTPLQTSLDALETTPFTEDHALHSLLGDKGGEREMDGHYLGRHEALILSGKVAVSASANNSLHMIHGYIV